MILVCYNVFGLFVRHLSWSVEGGAKVSKHPVVISGEHMKALDDKKNDILEWN